MAISAIITLLVIFGAIILFVTEWLTVDLVGLLIILSLVLSGVISPQEGVSGFSNSATLTVAFMFVISAALLKTGALQVLATHLSGPFRERPTAGLMFMALLVAVISAFVNNTPVVAVFIPVVIQIAHASGRRPSQLLIPLSYASIFGGMCTLIGTSTNILVSGIAEDADIKAFSMFSLAPIGLVLLVVGVLYLAVVGRHLLPDREGDQDLADKFGLRDYLTEIELLDRKELVGKRIMDSILVKEMDMEIIEVRRNGSRFFVPPGDFVLQNSDVLKVRCDVDKMRALKDWVKVADRTAVQIGGAGLGGRNTTLVELVVSANSEFEGKTLRELDFRRKYRAAPLAIRHREEVLHEQLYQVRMKAGDVILAEIKSHYVGELKRIETEQDAPFILLSEAPLLDFNRRSFATVMLVVAGVVFLATANVLPIMVATLLGVVTLVLLRELNMKEVYEAINWKIVFLLAGALTLGTAMRNSGLDADIAGLLVDRLGTLGPHFIVAGLFLTTSILTEIMSNNATAALLAPIAIAMADQLGVAPMPLLVTITIAASASFMTPVGYQTNAMVYSAGQYRFTDFLRVGVWLTLMFWLLCSLLIPVLYDF